MQTASISQLLFFFLCFSGAFAKSHDFIVIGGGSPGSVIGDRLSENKTTTVKVLERGVDRCELLEPIVGFWDVFWKAPSDVPSYEIPVPNKYIYDVHYFSTENRTQNREIPMPFLRGGAAMRNGNAATRLSAEELARFNSSLWTFDATNEDWKALFSYGKCFSSEGCNTTAHGTEGPVRMNTYPPDNVLSLINHTIAGTFGLSWNEDSNDGNNRGISLIHRNIKEVDGWPYRQEPYCSLLRKHLNGRDNLEMLSNAKVLRIIFRNNGKHIVEYLYNGNVYHDLARKGVVLSAGAIENPHILKLSGAGSCDELQKFGIECVVENPQIGANLLDGVQATLLYATPEPSGGHPGSLVVGYFDDFEVASGTFKVEISPGNIIDTALFFIVDMQHGGLGQVRLKTSNPLDDPIVSLNIYDEFPNSIKRLIDIYRTTRKAMNETGFPALIPSTQELPIDASDEEYAVFLNGPEGATNEWHFTGTSSMHLVVDERLRLMDKNKNVIPGVYIAGNDIVPNVIRSHSTTTTSMWIGQVASRLIKEDFGL